MILAGVSISALTDSELFEKTKTAKEQNERSQVEEEVKIAIMSLKIEESQKELKTEEKRKLLEDELRKQKADSTVSINGTGFLVKHKGYEVEIDNNYKLSIEEAFDAEEWDKTATPEEYFEWDEAGTTIVGYKENLSSFEKIRIPSKCIAIIPNSVWTGSSSTREITSRGVKEVELPDTIISIGDCSFADFKELTEVNIPDNVTSIGSKAFMCTGITSIAIPNSVTTIGAKAFQNCESLTSIVIPASVVSIGEWAFFSTEATSIIVDSNNKVYDSRENCNAIIESASNKLIQGGCNTKIPDSVTSIGEDAFRSCDSLTSITIPGNIVNVGNWAFAHCSNLENITISEGVKNLGIGVFSDCTSLTSVKIPSSVTKIEQQLFRDCTNLADITIPESVTYIWGTLSFGSISDTAVYNVVEGSYADTWVQKNKYGNQTINYITE